MEIVVNRTKSKAQHQKKMLAGETYLVAPATILTVGVHNGSKGPLYYPESQLRATASDWDYKPATILHAVKDDEIKARTVGFLQNTRFRDGKLITEVWLSEARLKKVDKTVLKKILKNQMVEVSTGLYFDKDNTSGLWRNKRYDGIAKNYRPHHLAILPDIKGACSIADSCGLLQDVQNERNEMSNYAEAKDYVKMNFPLSMQEPFLSGLERLENQQQTPNQQKQPHYVGASAPTGTPNRNPNNKTLAAPAMNFTEDGEDKSHQVTNQTQERKDKYGRPLLSPPKMF